jgi:tripeptide aminopeptidase
MFEATFRSFNAAARRASGLRPLRAVLAASALATAPPLGAQVLRIPSERANVQAALQWIRANNRWTLDQQVSLTEIPAPPFKEAIRAAEFKRRLGALGLENVRIDFEGNVIGERSGAAAGPVIVLSGHLDTVFPEGTDVRVKRKGTMLRAPGIGDDGRGLAVLLAVARALREARIETDGTILFVGTVGEEGPGNLRGVRHLFETELKRKVDYFISVDGTGYGITSRAVGSHRYRVTVRGPGGHSFGDFGMPNPIHALGRAVAMVAELRVPRDPKTTFNVGVITGGTSVNSIAGESAMDVDLRSESARALGAVERDFRRAVRRAVEAEHARWPGSATRLTVRIDTIGVRPAATQPDTALIVRVARAARQALNLPDRPTRAGSTDANIPLSLGVPSITIDGGGNGDGSHSLGEWYDDGADGYRGAQWAMLVVLALAGMK